jgi:DNA-binding Lrp family transcriptional regulator
MIIETNEQGILIKPTAAINMAAVQMVIDYVNVLEITSRNQGTEEEAAEWANQTDRKWLEKNKHRFIK